MTEAPVMIEAPKLNPFVPIDHHRCVACGGCITLWERFCAHVMNRSLSIMSYRYCSGHKAPTEAKGMMQAMMTGESEIVNPCAGISEPHLHLTCKGCGFSLLMRTKTAVRL